MHPLLFTCKYVLFVKWMCFAIQTTRSVRELFFNTDYKQTIFPLAEIVGTGWRMLLTICRLLQLVVL
uniref:Putative secreted protein n=1 Tax=Anopheles marajoara TaxID=58244 RepID=A0A2M4CFK8_9DIPT